jgi:large subunit ribosomal protein L27e
MKPGRIVILLAGRHAGKKAIIVRQHDDGKKVRLRTLIGLERFERCLIALIV